VKKANFVDLDKVLKNLEISEVRGVLLDLGMSSYQIENSGRGFSFSRNEPLDMRMDPDETLTAGHLVNNLSSKELERILRDFGEERRAKLIARAIVSARSRKPIDTSSQLAVTSCYQNISGPQNSSQQRIGKSRGIPKKDTITDGERGQISRFILPFT